MTPKGRMCIITMLYNWVTACTQTVSSRLYFQLLPLALGRDKEMSEIRVKDNESLDSALRRFKRSCQKSGVLAEVRKREAYEKPSVKRKKKSEAARKRKFK